VQNASRSLKTAVKELKMHKIEVVMTNLQQVLTELGPYASI